MAKYDRLFSLLIISVLLQVNLRAHEPVFLPETVSVQRAASRCILQNKKKFRKPKKSERSRRVVKKRQTVVYKRMARLRARMSILSPSAKINLLQRERSRLQKQLKRLRQKAHSEKAKNAHIYRGKLKKQQVLKRRMLKQVNLLLKRAGCKAASEREALWIKEPAARAQIEADHRSGICAIGKEMFGEAINPLTKERLIKSLNEQKDTLTEQDYQNAPSLIRTIQNADLPIRAQPLMTRGELGRTYTVDGKKFRLQNVSGAHLRCYFNAMGLDVVTQIDRLIQSCNDPVVRYMIANEVVAASRAGSAFDPLVEQETGAIWSGDDPNFEPLRKRAFGLDIFKIFVERYLISEQMLAFEQNVLGLSGQESVDLCAQSTYLAINAIAYLNKLGLKIYLPEQVRARDEKGNQIQTYTGNLTLRHQFTPQGATEVVYLYYSNLHFQTLIPVNQGLPS